MQAAQDLHKLGPKFVLVKGGHLIAAPHTDPSELPSDAPRTPSSNLAQAPSTSTPSTQTSASSAMQDSQPDSAAQCFASSADSTSGLTQVTDEPASNPNVETDSATGQAKQDKQPQSQSRAEVEVEQDTRHHNGKHAHQAGNNQRAGNAVHQTIESKPFTLQTCFLTVHVESLNSLVAVAMAEEAIVGLLHRAQIEI